MCRWMAYSGEPITADDLHFRRNTRSSTRACTPRCADSPRTVTASASAGTTTTPSATPGLFKGTHPAWNDQNLREVATHIRTPLLFAHVRASSGTPVQRSNCHPFRYGRWLWMHNGSLAGFPEVKPDLLMAVDASLYPHIEASTDTETLFFLGLTDDPPPRWLARSFVTCCGGSTSATASRRR
jgi:predicted glutamine amidotransferase